MTCPSPAKKLPIYPIYQDLRLKAFYAMPYDKDNVYDIETNLKLGCYYLALQKETSGEWPVALGRYFADRHWHKHQYYAEAIMARAQSMTWCMYE